MASQVPRPAPLRWSPIAADFSFALLRTHAGSICPCGSRPAEVRRNHSTTSYAAARVAGRLPFSFALLRTHAGFLCPYRSRPRSSAASVPPAIGLRWRRFRRRMLIFCSSSFSSSSSFLQDAAGVKLVFSSKVKLSRVGCND